MSSDLQAREYAEILGLFFAYATNGDELLDKYTRHGDAQFLLPDALELPPINHHGNVMEIAAAFGGEDRLVEAVSTLQNLLYAA